MLVSPEASNDLYDATLKLILSGQAKAGSPIRQDSLALEFGVSKIPVREALVRLCEDGLVEQIPNRGFFVRPLLYGEMEDIFDLRLKLEPDLVVAAARVATANDKALAKRAFEAFGNGAAIGDETGALNRAFHLALARPAGREISLTILERLLRLSQRYVRVHLEPEDRPQRALAEHQHLLKLWLDGDVTALKSAIHDHIQATLTDLRQQLVGADI